MIQLFGLGCLYVAAAGVAILTWPRHAKPAGRDRYHGEINDTPTTPQQPNTKEHILPWQLTMIIK